MDMPSMQLAGAYMTMVRHHNDLVNFAGLLLNTGRSLGATLAA